MTTRRGAYAEWLDTRAAAAYCSCHPETIRRAIRAGALRAWPVGRTLKTKREYLDAWIVTGGRTHTTVEPFTYVKSDEGDAPCRG